MTLYNPYRNMDYEISAGGITVNIGQYAEEKISQANTIIRTVCKEKNIVLADYMKHLLPQMILCLIIRMQKII